MLLGRYAQPTAFVSVKQFQDRETGLGAARKEDLVYPDAVRKNHPFNSFII